jgi:hypothetical protein
VTPKRNTRRMDLQRILLHNLHVDSVEKFILQLALHLKDLNLTSSGSLKGQTAGRPTSRAYLIQRLGERCLMTLAEMAHTLPPPVTVQTGSFVVKKLGLRPNNFIPTDTVLRNHDCTIYIKKLSSLALNELIKNNKIVCKIVVCHVVPDECPNPWQFLGTLPRRSNILFGPFVNHHTREMYEQYITIPNDGLDSTTPPKRPSLK